MNIVSSNIQSAVGLSHLCAGQKSGCEADVHAMQKLHASDIEGVLLFDASNAFNGLNRKVMLHNIQWLCPSFATCVLNYYRSDATLFVGGENLLSAEGTSQGDPYQWRSMLLVLYPDHSCTGRQGLTNMVC